MAHPMAGQAKASQKARLRRLGAHAGKPWGSSSMYKKTKLPSKNAGTDREFTISGGKSRKRADRAAQKLADGGRVRGKHHKPHHTTNIVIAAPGGAGGRGGGGGGGARPAGPMPVPVPRPVPVPVHPGLPAGGPPGAPPMGGAPMGGPMGGPIGGLGAPPGAALPPRPPLGGPAAGMKHGGHVKKRKNGGAYPGFPHSPTADTDAVSAHRDGGHVEPEHVKKRQVGGGTLSKKDGDDGQDQMDQAQSSAASAMPSSMAQTQRHGGKVKKRQMGGGSGLPYGGLIGPRPGIQTAQPAQQGAPTISGREARPALPAMVPSPGTLAAQRARPAPGTTVGFKRGGKAEHGDEAEDKKLFTRMFKKEEAKEGKEEKVKKRKHGGFTGLPGVVNHDVGTGMGSAREMANPYDMKKTMGVSETPGTVKKRKHGGSAGDSVQSAAPMRGLNESKYHDWGVGHRKRGGHVGDSITMAAPTHLAEPKYKDWGVGKRQMGGAVHPRPGAGSGLGRIRGNKIAAKVPAKTEL